jgi:Ferritin-like
MPSSKLLPRNVAALRAMQNPQAPVRVVAGNSVSTRLESGIGNFFPGLECDLRNLERRFFPFLEVDPNYNSNEVFVVSVNVQAAADANAAGRVSAADFAIYRTIDGDLARGASWLIETIDGDFGPLGRMSIRLADLTGDSFGRGRTAPDAWTAIRLLKEDADVTISLTQQGGARSSFALTAKRARYLDDNGALARMFAPGELTQSLCSPWTHDFRDCACYYWASNHPDVALPPLPSPTDDATDPRWGLDTAWERFDRSLQSPPAANVDGADSNVGAGSRAIREMAHHEINANWQLLNFVTERRERMTIYAPGMAPDAAPFPDDASLLTALRYGAGVEIAVMLEYLSAAWSLQKPERLPAALRDDVRASFAEIRRIAVGEMRHLRAINDVIFDLSPPGAMEPALAVASDIPFGKPGMFRSHQFRAAGLDTIDAFVEIEAPSESVDGLYARVFASLDGRRGAEQQAQAIRTVISEGGDHYQTFKFIREWLGRHAPDTSYLIAPAVPPPPDNAAHRTLQQRYRELLDLLYRGYKMGLPAGGSTVNEARAAMLGPGGIEGALDAVAAQGFLPVFDPVDDPRFRPIAHPT